jgi:hypothetical protein
MCDYAIVQCRDAEHANISSVFCLELARDGNFLLSHVHEELGSRGGAERSSFEFR